MTQQDEIAEYLALNTVTKCPTVCLNKTTAKTNKEDRKLLKQHHDKQSALADARFKRQYYTKMFFSYLLGISFLPIIVLLEYLT